MTANPNYEKAYIGSAVIHIQRNNLDQAIEQLKKAEMATPQNREVHLMLAGIYEKKGDPKLAEYHSLLGGKGKSTPETSAKHAESSTTNSGVDKEIEELKAVVREHPGDVLSYEKLGTSTVPPEKMPKRSRPTGKRHT